MAKMQGFHPITWLTCLMFMVFAMTTDAVGVIIPEVVKEYDLSLTQAGALHYATMIAIALSGLLLGHLADSRGRKFTIVAGLLLFALACFLLAFTQGFYLLIGLLACTGAAIGLFKTGALALIGDISSSSQMHTKTMNMVEGFFAVGAIIGPAMVTYFLSQGQSWILLYVVAGLLCVMLALVAFNTKYPAHPGLAKKADFSQILILMKDPYALGFSLAIGLYVATEVAIYVWMPSLLQEYSGSYVWLSMYALTFFFIFRAIGRFAAIWILQHFCWTWVAFWLCLGIFICYVLSMWLGVNSAAILLPLTGIFMSMLYPTINSKGISCFPVHLHGSVAGLLLFFTAVAAALGPLLMGLVGDIFGHVKYGFYLATLFSGALFVLSAFNAFKQPAKARLAQS